MSDTKTVTVSFPWLGLFAIVLTVLKLLGYIDLSWWWVLAPFWAPWVVIGVLFGMFIVAAVIVKALDV